MVAIYDGDDWAYPGVWHHVCRSYRKALHCPSAADTLAQGNQDSRRRKIYKVCICLHVLMIAKVDGSVMTFQ